MKALRWVAVLLFAVLGPGGVRADMRTPGFKSLGLQVVFDNLDDFPEYRFYRALRGWQPQDSDPEPESLTSAGFRINDGKGNAFTLTAVPRRWADPAKRATSVILYSDMVVCPQRAEFPGIWPVDYEERHFRIELAPDRVILTPGQVEMRSDGFRSWVPGLLTTGVLITLGMWLVRRVRRPR
jgi:hypothetical protein